MPDIQLQFSNMSMSSQAQKAWNEYNKSQRILRLRKLNLNLRSVSNG